MMVQSGVRRVSVLGWPEWDIRAVTGSYIKFISRLIIQLNVRGKKKKKMLLENNTIEYCISL